MQRWNEDVLQEDDWKTKKQEDMGSTSISVWARVRLIAGEWS